MLGKGMSMDWVYHDEWSGHDQHTHYYPSYKKNMDVPRPKANRTHAYQTYIN